jgi:hypothetical protein
MTELSGLRLRVAKPHGNSMALVDMVHLEYGLQLRIAKPGNSMATVDMVLLEGGLRLRVAKPGNLCLS